MQRNRSSSLDGNTTSPILESSATSKNIPSNVGHVGAGSSSNSLPCKFYLMGHCESGKYCRFSHIKPHESPKLICSYFLKGTCKFGNRCLLSHDLACPRQTPNFTSDSTSNGREGSLSAKKQNAGRLSTSLEQKPDPKMTTDSVEPTHVSSSEDPNYDKLLFGDEEDADDILNMIGEELKNHCSISSSMPSSAIDVNVDFECSINSKAEQEAAPRSGTDYSRLARMYTLNPNVSTQSRQTVIVEELPQEPLCTFAKTGSCRYTDKCKYLHGELCPYCKLFVLHPYRQELQQAHLSSCSNSLVDQQLNAATSVQQLECGICYEKIFSKADSRIGLLNCDHSFCLECIRAWRQSQTMDTTVVRSCPICRIETHFITPSSQWPYSAEEKEFIIEEYKSRLKTIPCKYIKNGASVCPFGSSCFYAHLDGQGNPIEQSKLRVYRNNEQELRIMTQVKLSDFINSSTVIK